MKKPVQRDDVARLAGVSPATVSYVINNGPRPVAPETRAKVLEVIQKLGYRPNAVARNLRLQRTFTLGLILPDTLNPYFAEVARGIEQVAFERGYVVVQCHSDFSLERELQFVELLYAERAAGVLWFPTSGDPEPARRLGRYRIPLVVMDRLVAGVEATSVVSDNFRGAYLATQHLIDCGHRRIGCIARPSDLSHSQQRIQGYLAALENNGIGVDRSLITYGGYRQEDGRAATHELLRRDPRPTAIFAYNDFMAIGALRAAFDLKLHVPADLAIAGFDDIPQAAMTCPSLTTVSQPKSELGRCAAEMLLDLVQDKEPPSKQVVLDVRLVIRESTQLSQAQSN